MHASSVKRTNLNSLLKLGLVAVGGVAGLASASEYAGVTVNIDGWTIVPVHDTTATTHLIALRDNDGARATDIDTVVYERTATGWDAEAYAPGVSKEDAMLHVASELGLADPMSLDWELGLEAAGVTGAPVSRAPFGKGFFVSDPLFDVADAMDDPTPLADAAEQLGLPSAASVVTTGGVSIDPVGDPIGIGDCGCSPLCIQAPIADGVDAYLFDATVDFQAAESLARAAVQANSNCCLWWIWTSQPTWTVSCGPWYFHEYTISSNNQAKNCRYRRIVTEVGTRFRIKVCWDCSMVSVTQTRTITDCQGGRETVLAIDPCPDASTVGEPAAGCARGGCEDFTGTDTGWTPPLASCP